MNRAFFIILFVALLIIPLSINNVNNEGISYFELIAEIGIGMLEDSETEKEINIVVSESQKNKITKKLNSLNDSNNNLLSQFEALQTETLKDVNAYVAKENWKQFSETNGGIKGIYLSGYHLLIEEKIKPIKEIVNNTVVNTIVLDVKTDNGHLMYDSQIDSVAELKNERIKYDSTTLQELQNELDIYLIGRVVAFQDPIFSRKYIESAIIDSKTNSPYSQNGQYFLDPSDKKSREYVLNIALEACLLGFDEIQFDYIRYPDTSYQGLVYDEVSSFENRTKNINSFLSEATKALHDIGCLASADIFGYVLNAKNDNGIGQYLETIVESVDFISPMVYPSHYSRGSFGYDYPNSHPYEVVTAALNRGLSRDINEEQLRPFLQGFWQNSVQGRYMKYLQQF